MYCPNPECPFFVETGTPAEYRQEIAHCTDCGSVLQSEKPRGSSVPRSPGARQEAVHGEAPEPERLVTLATYSNPESAHYAQGILESVGLTAFVGDDHVAGMAPPLGMVIRGVKLNVRAQDADQALGVLEEYHLVESDEPAGEAAPSVDEPKYVESPEESEDESAEAFFINLLFSVFKWGSYAFAVVIVILIVAMVLRS